MDELKELLAEFKEKGIPKDLINRDLKLEKKYLDEWRRALVDRDYFCGAIYNLCSI